MTPRFLIFVPLVLLASLSIRIETSNAQSPPTHQHSFGDAQQWSHYFDDPKRDEWQKPHEVIQALELVPNSVVADVGYRYWVFLRPPRAFCAGGTVYGVDTEADMVKYLEANQTRSTIKRNFVGW